MRSNAKQVFKKLQAKFDRIRREAPKVLANEGVKAFKSNFETQSFDGRKWNEVQRRIPGTPEYKYPKKLDLKRRTRPILIGKTRELKRSVTGSIREANSRRIRWATYVKYAERQNEKRTFMGADFRFKKRLRSKFEQMYKRI